MPLRLAWIISMSWGIRGTKREIEYKYMGVLRGAACLFYFILQTIQAAYHK